MEFIIKPQIVPETEAYSPVGPGLTTKKVVTAAKKAGKSGAWVLEGGMSLAVTRPDSYWFYDMDGSARRISRTSIPAVVRDGLRPNCPLCAGYHPESETNPNACPARPKVAERVCPQCAEVGNERVFYDILPPGDLDPDEWVAGAAERLQIRYRAHLRAFHKATAAMMGVGECSVCDESSDVDLNGVLYCKAHAVEALNA